MVLYELLTGHHPLEDGRHTSTRDPFNLETRGAFVHDHFGSRDKRQLIALTQKLDSAWPQHVRETLQRDTILELGELEDIIVQFMDLDPEKRLDVTLPELVVLPNRKESMYYGKG